MSTFVNRNEYNNVTTRLVCLDSNCECKMTKQQFSTRIGMRKINGMSNGVIWYKGKAQRVWSLNIPQLKQHFGIVPPVEFVDIE